MYTRIEMTTAKRNMNRDPNITVLDVRTQDEYKEGHIAGSIFIPYEEVASKISEIIKNKYATIYVYCLSGFRSRIACLTLIKNGYTNVYDMGGIRDWKDKLEK